MAETNEGIELVEGTLSADDKVVRIATQAEETYNTKGSLWDTYFYKVVLAGNVDIIKRVVSRLENIGATQTLDWLFQRQQKKKKTSFTRLKITRLIVYIIVTLVNILLTPIFYALHLFIGSTLNRKRKNVSKNIELPLAYAAFSKKPDMIAFFLSQGVDINYSDRNQNNVFHYISDLSAVAPEAAIQIFRKLINEIDDQDDVKKLVEHDRNSSGLAAVEYAAKFGSPSLLSQILKQPGIMHQTALSAKADQVVFSDTARIQDAKTRLEVLDVTKYEAGTMTDQSTILNILSDRDVASMSKPELRIFKGSEFIGTWLEYKCKQMLNLVIFYNICDVIITCLLLYILAMSFIGKYGVEFRQWRRNEDIKVQLSEFEAWSNNTSSIFKHNAFHDRINKKRLLLQQQWWESMWKEDSHKVELVLKMTSLYQVTLIPPKVEGTKSFKNFTDNDMDNMYEHAYQMQEFENLITQLNIVRLYPDIVFQFGREISTRRSEVFDHFDNAYTYKNMPLLYENFTIKVNETVIVPSIAVTLGKVISQLCVMLPETTVQQFRDTPPDFFSVTFEDLQELDPPTDSCFYQSFINVAVKNTPCKGSDPETLKEMLQPLHDFGDSTMIYMTTFVIICMYVYIIIDGYERCLFLTKSVRYHTSVLDMVYTALVQKVPGSYVHKQLNIFAGVVLIYQFHLHQYVHSDNFEKLRQTMEDYYRKEGDVSMLFIVAIVLRFIVHIHALRIVPSVGNFVITMFMMGTNLLHFSTVFGIVLFIFSVFFYILIDDPDCPLESLEGFQTLAGSIFATFKLTFGHGDLNQYFRGAQVQLLYMLYMIIVVLLLLNLIIAIMSSTATDIMAEPWRTVLWKIEWLDEATSVEFSFSAISLPFRKFGLRRKVSSHRNAGYIVKRNQNGTYKVNIECFHCPGLEA